MSQDLFEIVDPKQVLEHHQLPLEPETMVTPWKGLIVGGKLEGGFFVVTAIELIAALEEQQSPKGPPAANYWQGVLNTRRLNMIQVPLAAGDDYSVAVG